MSTTSFESGILDGDGDDYVGQGLVDAAFYANGSVGAGRAAPQVRFAEAGASVAETRSFSPADLRAFAGDTAVAGGEYPAVAYTRDETFYYN